MMYISLNKDIYYTGDKIYMVCKLHNEMVSESIKIHLLYREVSGIDVKETGDIDGLGGMTLLNSYQFKQNRKTIWKHSNSILKGGNEFSCVSPIIPEWMETTQTKGYTDSYGVYFEIRVEGTAKMINGGLIFLNSSKSIPIKKNIYLHQLERKEFETHRSKCKTTVVTCRNDLYTGLYTTVYIEEKKNKFLRRGATVKLKQIIYFKDAYGERAKKFSVNGKYVGTGRYIIDVLEDFIDSNFSEDKNLTLFKRVETFISISPSNLISNVKSLHIPVKIHKVLMIDME